MNRTTIAARWLAAVALTAMAAACEIPGIADDRQDGGAVTLVDVTPSTDEALRALPIAPEDTGAHYDRDDWPHWREQGGGCDTRQLVLQQQALVVDVGTDCTIRGGEWVSPYDGVTVTDPRDLDIDHIVPLAEVARSGRIVDGRRTGPRSWTREQRAAYANDPAVLVAVTASSNRAKGDNDPARWLPDHDQCGYVTRWVTVKTSYGLSTDQAEHDAITSVLRRCGTKGGNR